MEITLNQYLILFLHLSPLDVFAENFCSKDNRRVKCVPCVDLDNSSTPYRCPKQCDNNLNNQHFCNKVCNKFCLNSVCEYENGSLKCSEGCKDGLTGRYCQEICPVGCKTCGQFKSDCTACKGGYLGMKCSEQKPMTTARVIPEQTQTDGNTKGNEKESSEPQREFPEQLTTSISFEHHAENVTVLNAVNKEAIVVGIIVAVAFVATITSVLIKRHRNKIVRRKRKEAESMCESIYDEAGQVNLNPQYSALQGNAVGNALYTGLHIYEKCDAV